MTNVQLSRITCVCCQKLITIFPIIFIKTNKIKMATISWTVTGGVIAALLKAPRMKRRQAARVTEN